MSVELDKVAGAEAFVIKEEIHIEQESITIQGTSTDTQDGELPKNETLTVHRSTIVIHREITIIRSLYIEACSHLELDSEEEADPTCCERCTDLCCQSCTCNFKNPFKEKTFISMEKRGIITDTLRKGRARGWNNVYKNIVFPLIQDTVRDVWVFLELATVLIGLILSIVSLSLDQNRAFNYLHFALIALSSILAIVDGLSILKNFKSCKGYFRGCCNVDCRTNRVADVEASGEVDTKGCIKNCCSCYKTASDVIDITRMILTEMLVYPVLICDIFELIVGRGYEGNTSGDRLGFALFILSCLSLFMYVYVARIIVLVGMIKHVQEALENDDFSSSALWYQVYFFIHVVQQMLLQVLIIIAIGGKIRYDNRHFYEDGNTDESIHVSGYLWYMIVAGYVLPTMGFFTFFLVTYYWTQEFPVGLLLNMIRLMKTGDPEELVCYQGRQKVSRRTVLQLIERFVRIDILKKDFSDLHKESWCSKFGYPFTSPMLVSIFVVYSGIHLAFIVCFVVGAEGLLATVVFSSLILFGVIANAYAAAVATVWIAIAIAVIAAISTVAAVVLAAVGVVIVFGVIAILCGVMVGFCKFCCSDDD